MSSVEAAHHVARYSCEGGSTSNGLSGLNGPLFPHSSLHIDRQEIDRHVWICGLDPNTCKISGQRWIYEPSISPSVKMALMGNQCFHKPYPQTAAVYCVAKKLVEIGSETPSSTAIWREVYASIKQ